METKALLGHQRNETCTRLEVRIVEFAVALVLLKMRRILRRQESALVVIEPPGDFGRTGVLEIDDGVFVAVKLPLVKESAGAMQQSGELEIDVIADSLPVKTRKQRRRRGAVKTLV